MNEKTTGKSVYPKKKAICENYKEKAAKFSD